MAMICFFFFSFIFASCVCYFCLKHSTNIIYYVPLLVLIYIVQYRSFISFIIIYTSNKWIHVDPVRPFLLWLLSWTTCVFFFSFSFSSSSFICVPLLNVAFCFCFSHPSYSRLCFNGHEFMVVIGRGHLPKSPHGKNNEQQCVLRRPSFFSAFAYACVFAFNIENIINFVFFLRLFSFCLRLQTKIPFKTSFRVWNGPMFIFIRSLILCNVFCCFLLFSFSPPFSLTVISHLFFTKMQ